MSEEEKLHNELEENYEKIVEMLSNGNFLQLNGKAINLTELNEYINAQQEEIERLNNIINELEQTLEKLIKEQLEQYNKREENWEERKGVSNTWLTSRDCYYSILKYLQKLKGVDKE